MREGATTEEEEGNRDAGGWASRAGDLRLPEPPGQDKAGRPRLIADPQFGARMGLAQFGEDLLIRLRLTLRAACGCLSPFGRFQGVQVVGDGAVRAGGAAVARGEADGDGFARGHRVR